MAAARPGESFALLEGEGLVLDVKGTNKTKFSLPTLVNENALLKATSSAYNKHSRLKAHLSSIPEMGAAAKSKSPGEPLRIMAADGTEFFVNDTGELVVRSGWVCVDAPDKTIISTELGKVYCKKNAFVNVEQIPGYFRVASCSDPGSVFVSYGKYGVPLAEGEEVLFCDHTPSAEEIAAGDGLMRRKLKAAKLDGSSYAIFGEFSIYSMLYNASQLRPLRLANKSEDKHTLNQLIRTLSRIQFSTGSRGDYSEAPVITGFLPGKDFEQAGNYLTSYLQSSSASQ